MTLHQNVRAVMAQEVLGHCLNGLSDIILEFVLRRYRHCHVGDERIAVER